MTLIVLFQSIVRRLVCYTAVFSVVTQRNDTKNGCVADYQTMGSNVRLYVYMFIKFVSLCNDLRNNLLSNHADDT